MDKDIFDLAMAKKLFGGGGGKREGTAIPAGEEVNLIFFNLANTTEQTNALLSQLTFVETPLLTYPIYAVYANTEDGNKGDFIIVVKVEEDRYNITKITNIAQSVDYPIYDTEVADDRYNGWTVVHGGSEATYGFIGASPIITKDGQSLTDFNGIPVGAENEKIKNVLSITPF